MQPKFTSEPDVSEIREPVRPALKLCTMSADGHLSIPRAERDKWLADPIRSCLAQISRFRFPSDFISFCNIIAKTAFISDPDWRTRLANFDSVFSPAGVQNVAVANASSEDLGNEAPIAAAVAPSNSCDIPPHITTEEFNTRYPEVTCSVVVSMGGQSITCHYVDNKVFIVCAALFMLPGALSDDAKPIFLYAGGSWISDSSKACCFSFGDQLFYMYFLLASFLQICFGIQLVGRQRISSPRRPMRTKLWSLLWKMLIAWMLGHA